MEIAVVAAAVAAAAAAEAPGQLCHQIHPAPCFQLNLRGRTRRSWDEPEEQLMHLSVSASSQMGIFH